VTGRVANLRQIDWRSLGINFFTMFSPGALEAAPQTDIATVRAASPAVEERLSQAVGDAFPNVSGIRVSEQLATLDKLLAGMAEAIELTAAFCIATGLLVLMGAVAAGQAERIRDAVILKVLGATRPMMARGLLMEFGLVGGVAALLAAGLGTLAAWLLVTRFMKGDWSFAWGRMAAIVVGGAAVTMLLALGATWRALGTSSAARLRQD
jgi:putative ABC transport system permease protein